MTEPHDITVRKVKFEFPDELDDVLPGNDPVRETYMVAFSLTMPCLEPYLIRTFRSVADDITDPGLAADVKEFIGQEAQHFQNHRRINEIIKGQLGASVAADLQVELEQVNVKATTTEKLGFAGREEGIAVHAVALLLKA